MTTIYGSATGEIVRLLLNESDEQRHGPPAAYGSSLKFDPDTNGELLAGLNADWQVHRLADGVLYHNGEPVAVNPPGGVWQTREDFRNLPGWATWTGQQAADYIRADVLNGMTKPEVEAWVENNITGTTVTQLRNQLKTALKLLAGEMIDQREISQKTAQAIMCLRDMR